MSDLKKKHSQIYPNSFTAFLETNEAQGFSIEGERMFPESLIGSYLQWFLQREGSEVNRILANLTDMTKERNDAIEAAGKYQRIVLNDGRFQEDIDALDLKDKQLANYKLALAEATSNYRALYPNKENADEVIEQIYHIANTGEIK